MSEPYVNSYDKILMEAFKSDLDEMPVKAEHVIKKHVDAIHDAVVEKVFNYVAEDMKHNLDMEIKQAAADVARSMLMNALAGDSKEIRNLFGFNDYYMRNPYIGNLPTQFKLIDEIVSRHPEVFLEERAKQLNVRHQQALEGLRRMSKDTGVENIHLEFYATGYTHAADWVQANFTLLLDLLTSARFNERAGHLHELDVLLNGEDGAAKEPAIIDIISQVKAYNKKHRLKRTLDAASMASPEMVTSDELEARIFGYTPEDFYLDRVDVQKACEKFAVEFPLGVIVVADDDTVPSQKTGV